MIDPRLQAFLANPVMVVAAAGDGECLATLARGMGVRARPEVSSIEVFISRAQWRATVDALQPGGWMAVTVCRPETYETYQIKGRIESCTPPRLRRAGLRGGLLPAHQRPPAVAGADSATDRVLDHNG